MRRTTVIAVAIALSTAVMGVGIGPATAANTRQPYSIAEVRKHNKATDCWAVINKRVYNLTKWVAQHPGGAGAITRLCGTDGIKAFTGKHGGQSGPASQLAKYQIGVLR